MTRIDKDTYPEIIQAARWMDADHGTPHFEPGAGFIVDDPDGLEVPPRWSAHLPTIEAALAGLDHVNPHPQDTDTLDWLKKEGKESDLYSSETYNFVSGEDTVVQLIANRSPELTLANRFLNARFEGWDEA